MSATSETLMEQLRQIDEQIVTLEASGGDSTGLRKSREKISEQFRAATHALNEGRTTVLKG
jgi:DNA repair ATPase RecN